MRWKQDANDIQYIYRIYIFVEGMRCEWEDRGLNATNTYAYHFFEFIIFEFKFEGRIHHNNKQFDRNGIKLVFDNIPKSSCFSAVRVYEFNLFFQCVALTINSHLSKIIVCKLSKMKIKLEMRCWMCQSLCSHSYVAYFTYIYV